MSGPLAGRLCGEERLKQLVLDLGRNADAVVADADFDRISEISRRHFQSGLEFRIASLLLALSGGVEAVADQVETDAGDVLGDEFDRGDSVSKISLQRDVEARILSTGTVVGEVQGFLEALLSCGAWTSPKRRQRCRRGTIPRKPLR